MNPWRLIAILEKSDPSFRDLFYPSELRCHLDDRIVLAIEQHWPAYFPTQKECRGPNWSLSIPENKPLYKPRVGSVQELNAWKKKIEGTVAEGRAYGADISWKRFFAICKKSERLRPFLKDFKSLADFLVQEESMWPRGGVAVGMESFLQGEMAALLATDSPYQYSDPQRLRFLKSRNKTIEKIQMIGLMNQLFDRPLMILAVLQKCADDSKTASFWLDLRHHINAILKTPAPLTFRMTWLEHAMRMSEATKKSGKACPRRWARLLLAGEKNVTSDQIDDSEVAQKAIVVNRWLKGKKQPTLESIRSSWKVIKAAKLLRPPAERHGCDRWIFSWMITLLMEKHFREISAAFKDDTKGIKNYYGRFFHYMEIDLNKTHPHKRAGGRNARQL